MERPGISLDYKTKCQILQHNNMKAVSMSEESTKIKINSCSLGVHIFPEPICVYTINPVCHCTGNTQSFMMMYC